ncbi:MAG TPA: tetratricopeptide repeat-containing sensor histidine kinase [Salinivirgaceae bacterium]|nr:tetratricopeptide repeat-containing sensor histidine kinase [Salinivirgaceae bacterium]
MITARYFIIICFITCLAFDANSQTIDSLFSQFELLQRKNADIELCNSLVLKLHDRGNLINKHIFNRNTPEDSIEMIIYYGTAEYLYEKSEFIKSNECAQLSLEISKKLNDNNYMFDNYSIMSCNYQRIGDLERAIENGSLALEVANITGDPKLRSSAFNNIGTIYIYSKQPEKGIEYLSESLELERTLDDDEKIATRLSNLSEAYLQIKNTDKALSLLLEALEIDRKANRTDKIGRRLSVLGSIYHEMNNLKEAERSYTEAIEVFNISNNGVSIAITYYQLAMLKFRENNDRESLSYFEKCISVCDSLDLSYVKHKAISGKYKIAKKIGDYKSALENLEIFVDMQDSIFNQQMGKKIADFQVKYEADKKDAQIKLQNEQLKRSKTVQIFLISLAISVLVISILLFLFARNKRNYAKKLELINKSKDKLFSIVSHDMKSPTIAQKMVVEDIIEHYDNYTTEEIKQYFGHLRDVSEAQVNLMQNLTDWSRIQTGKNKCNPIVFNLTEIVNDAVNLLSITAERKNIELITEMPDECYTFADRQMISTIIRNLINNAVKFSHSDSKVIIKITDLKKGWQVMVEDFGIGMNEKQVVSIFSKKETILSDGTFGEKGSGLGLIVSMEFIEKNNGKLLVESAINKGTKISFELEKAV